MNEKRARNREHDDGAGSIEPPAASSTPAWAGVTPMQQARSEATFHALIRAGRDALESKGLESMTIARLAEAAGASVGAFYGRFENRRAYFSAIQETVVAEVETNVRRAIDALDRNNVNAAEFLSAIAPIWVTIFRDNRGLYLAAFKDSTSQPGAWTPFKRLGWNMAALIVERLLPRLAELGKTDTEREIRIAMQFVNGLLVNATINDPGPIRLDDPEMEGNIARFLCSFFGLELPQKNGLKRSRKGIKGK